MNTSNFMRGVGHVVPLLFLMSIFTGCGVIPSKIIESPHRLKLAAVFSDNMVLQRGMELPIWGWAKPGTRVSVTLLDKRAVSVTDSKGNWLVKLGPFPAGGPYQLTVIAAKETIRLSNILIGDVWLASGQSNMEWPVAWSKDAKQEIAQANWPNIRLVTVPKRASEVPMDDAELPGWVECSPSTVGDFSAVAYFFGRQLHQHLNVAIGLIDCSWGGTSMEAWTRLGALQSDMDFQSAIEQLRKWVKEKNDPENIKRYQEAFKKWEEQTGGKQHHQDPGNIKFAEGWADPDHDTSDWKTISLPNFWEESELPDVDGVVWFRKEVDVPPDWLGKELRLSLGPIDDMDTTYFNGTKVGSIGLETNNYWSTPRVYTVSPSLVKSGRNVIAVRVFDHYIAGGFAGPVEKMFLSPDKEGVEAMSLAGTWVYKVSVALQQMPIKPGEYGFQVPTMLYNGMVNPLIPYGIKGVIWYQGESNVVRYQQYRKLSELMITDWRRQWSQGEFPFLFVQLAGLNWSDWPLLREAQLQTLEVPNTAMAVALDLGDEIDIHPKNKQDVGHRLALAARAIAYGKDIVYSGPIYKSMVVEDSTIRLYFDHIGSGLVSKGGDELKGFTIAGPDRKFLPAQARISGETVVVSHPDIKNPIAVRYAWNTFPDNDLYNKEGLPASPFRTDDFK